MPKLSFIIPVYQVKPYLERCLRSLLSQSFTNYEIVLVDDGSTDGSQDICDHYSEQYSEINVIHKTNGGLSSARNAGIEAASGEYIMFVDSDDLIHVNAVELEIKAIEEYDADALVCSFKRFRSESEIDYQTPLGMLGNISVLSGSEVEYSLFNSPEPARFVSSCGKVFKRELFDNIRFPEGRLFEDEFVTYKLYDNCKKVIVTDSELYFYYINPNGITQNLNIDKRFDEYDAQIERISFYKNKGDKGLLHKALLGFLYSAQWDLKSCQEGNQEYESARGTSFQNQYARVLRLAEQEKVISFNDNYDYYVLALPEKKNFFRIKRKIIKMVKKKIF